MENTTDSFTNQIKIEISNHDWSTFEEKKILLYSFMRTTGRFINGHFIFKTTLLESEAKIKEFYQLVFNHELKVEKTNKFVKFIIDEPEVLSTLAIYMGDFTITTKTETRAYIAGSFLGRGWINSLESKFYHFEIRVKDYQHSLDILEAFESVGIKATSLRKKYWYYVYIKKSQNISDTLKIMRSTAAALIFENKRIERQFLATVKKMNSIEPYNRKKIEEASAKQCDAVKICLENETKKKMLNANQLQLAKLRLERPTLSLSDLQMLYNELYNENYSRSTINNWLLRIMEISST